MLARFLNPIAFGHSWQLGDLTKTSSFVRIPLPKAQLKIPTLNDLHAGCPAGASHSKSNSQPGDLAQQPGSLTVHFKSLAFAGRCFKYNNYHNACMPIMFWRLKRETIHSQIEFFFFFFAKVSHSSNSTASCFQGEPAAAAARWFPHTVQQTTHAKTGGELVIKSCWLLMVNFGFD